MSKVSSVSIENKRLAYEHNSREPQRSINNNKVNDIFNKVIWYVSNGQREIDFNDLSEDTGLSKNSVKYYFDKLVSVGAISLYEY